MDEYAQYQELATNTVASLIDILGDDGVAIYSYDPDNEPPRCTIVAHGVAQVYIWNGGEWIEEPEVDAQIIGGDGG